MIFKYSQVEHGFSQVRLHERFNVSFVIKCILYNMYRMTHFNDPLQRKQRKFWFFVNQDDDRYGSGTEGDKHILQIVANGVLWLISSNTTHIKVSLVFSKIYYIHYYFRIRSLCHLYSCKKGREDRRMDFKHLGK